MMIFTLIVLTIVFAIELDKAQKENKKLKKELAQLKYKIESDNSVQDDKNNVETKILENNESYENTEIINKNNNQYKTMPQPKVSVRNKNDQQTKNTLILIAGAVLIVLSAIVFLLSTWNTIPNIIKTGTLLLLVGVFLGASSLAERKLKLNLTSKTFYYIAMAYIPIVILSISIFKLLGTYLSIAGEGKYLYFSICMIMLSTLYLIESIRNNRKPLLICSIITQVLSVIFTVLIFSSNFYSIVLGLLIYILVMYIISEHIEWDGINLKLISVILHIIMTVITLFATLGHWIMASCNIIDILNITIVTYIYYLIQRKNKNIKFAFDIGLLFIILTLINLEWITLSGKIKFLIITLAINLLYLFNYLKTHKVIYKIITYVALNFVLLSMAIVFNIENVIKYISFITTIIVMIIELLDRNDQIKYYLIVSFAVTFLVLNFEMNILMFICLLIAITFFIIHIKREHMNEWYMAIPMIAIIPSLYIPEIKLLRPYYLHVIISFTLITLTTVKSIINRKFNSIYLFASIVYILLSIASFEMNMYINLLLILLWAIAHAVTYEKPDVFKVVAYITGLVIYNNFISDIRITDLTIVSAIGYLSCIYLITRTVVKKYWKEYKILEYIFTSIVFLYALNSYVDISDAMIFIVFLLALVFFGYIRKVGPLFLTSLIAIVINVLKLTKEFWQSIPWWVYMLVVGSILITFAIRNEINEKQEKIKFGDLIKALKNRVDI